MEVPNNVEPMDSVVDAIPKFGWAHQEAREKFIQVAKILRGKGF